jgi:hypothetical protein
MNPYQLQRPTGEPSGVWACGQCGAIHFFAYMNRQPISETNRLGAEQCCAPRNCQWCGKPTEPGPYGQYPWAHPDCPPTYVPPPPHPSMSDPFARLLYEKMSSICEDRWAAGWLEGHEFEIWDALHGRCHPESTIALSPEEAEELRVLSRQAQGWIWCGGVGQHTPQLVPFDRWEELYPTRS